MTKKSKKLKRNIYM